jgi:hypothetical protein
MDLVGIEPTVAACALAFARRRSEEALVAGWGSEPQAVRGPGGD